MEYDITIDTFGDKFYYKKGTDIIHRECGPAIEYKNGDKSWVLNNNFHRADGPAVEWIGLGQFEWWIDGKRHREGGPAIEFTDGYREWHINGKRLSPEKETILNKWWNDKNGI